MKRPVTLLIVVLLATLFLSACGCPANLTAPGAGEVERSVIPAPEQSVPMHTFPSGPSSDNYFTSGDAQHEEVAWELYNNLNNLTIN